MGQLQSLNVGDLLALATFVIGSAVFIYNSHGQDVNVSA